MSDTALIWINHLAKAYGGVQALADVGLDIAAGEVHALCGENGAGKSTLIKILAGSVRPDAGEVLVNGSPLPLGNVQAAEAAGIAVIHQEIVAFPHLDARDNIFVGREPRRFGVLDRATMRRETTALLERLGEHFDMTRPVGELPLAQRQMVGIARALSKKCRLLIMDEPTASLSARETAVLFRIIRQLKSEGVSVLYVSHRLEEVFALTDRVTVLRDGRYVATTNIQEIDPPGLIKQMVGRELAAVGREQRIAPTDVLLEVEGLTRAGKFAEVSFQVRAGEIVGMAGLVGAGRSDVAETIFGMYRADAGSVRVNGRLALVPEDRQHLGLVLPMTVGENLTLAVLHRLARLGFRSKRRERAMAEKQMRELLVKAASADVPAQTLSGGNQQKLVLGKWLATEPQVLILDEPTRGVDVGAKAELYRLIRQLAERGLATLLISSDLPEVLLMSDRILVMRAGRISGELPAREATQERVLKLALPEETAGNSQAERREGAPLPGG